MIYWLIPLILGVLLLAVFLYFRVKEKRVIAVTFKGIVSLMFIATALVALFTSGNPNNSFGIFIIIGLFFGLLGDIFLDLKYIVLSKELLFTILGFVAFAIGHVFYSLGLFLYFYDYSSSVLYFIIPIIVTVILVGITLLLEKVSNIRYGVMRPFVVMYGLALFFTTSIYFSVAIQGGWQVIPMVIMSMGLIMFALSDLILNNTYFATGFNTPVFIITNHVIYYIAQFSIAASLFFLF